MYLFLFASCNKYFAALLSININKNIFLKISGSKDFLFWSFTHLYYYKSRLEEVSTFKVNKIFNNTGFYYNIFLPMLRAIVRILLTSQLPVFRNGTSEFRNFLCSWGFDKNIFKLRDEFSWNQVPNLVSIRSRIRCVSGNYCLKFQQLISLSFKLIIALYRIVA